MATGPTRAAPTRYRPDPTKLAAVFVGGIVGALARGGLFEAAPPTAGKWPWITFGVNLVGAFVLGCITERGTLRPRLAPFEQSALGTGFCGAFTTFATMQLELLQMLDDGRIGLALGYALLSVLLGYGAVVLGMEFVRRIWAGRR